MSEREKEWLKDKVITIFDLWWMKRKKSGLLDDGTEKAKYDLLDLIDRQPTEHDKQQWQLDLDYIEEAVKECVSVPRPYWLLPERIERIRQALGIEEKK